MTEPDTITRAARPHLIVMLERELLLVEHAGYDVSAQIIRHAVAELRCLHRVEHQ